MTTSAARPSASTTPSRWEASWWVPLPTPLGTLAGRASTAQGVYGATGTIALIIASVVAGALYAEHTAYPFWFFVIGMVVCPAIGLVIYFGPRARMGSGALADAVDPRPDPLTPDLIP